ncbi:hypothetical protein N9515_02330 [Vicingaceae bacterium]|nr:hypothetical protein [Vicingaceae bacterium]MDB4060778.1 hypothetical protein [Vicingaceae bacterium]
MKIGIQAALFVIAIILAYFIYDGVQNKIDFRDMAQKRSEIVQNRLQEIAVAQKKFKQEKGRYAANFPELINFVKNDSLTIIKAIGNVPDSLTEVEAVILGIVIRDTSLVPATSIFVDGFAADSLKYVPFGDGNEFKIQAGVIEKNKVNVNVFEVSTTLEIVYKGLKTKNEAIKLTDEIKVGSMNEPITTGNW